MKKTLLSILTTVALSFGLSAQNVNIPDANFKTYLTTDPIARIDTNLDGEISFTEASNFSGTINCPNSSISDLTGIEFFTNITGLYCNGNSLTALDVTNNTAIIDLYCNNNSLTALDVSANTVLKYLQCTDNLITSLDVSVNSALIELSCKYNSLTSLNVANGNNSNFITFYAESNSSLNCIQTDAGFSPPATWTKNAAAGYTTNCGHILVNSISVTGAANATTIATLGGTLQMSAAVLPSNATDANYTWSVASGTGSASISNTGLLTAITAGTVTVKAKANDASGKVGTMIVTLAIAYDFDFAAADLSGSSFDELGVQVLLSNNRHFPLSQLKSTDFQFGANVVNRGYQDISATDNTTLDLTIQKYSGTWNTIYTQSTPINTLSADNYGKLVTDEITDLTWLQTGDFRAIYTISSDVVDGVSGNDSISHLFSLNNNSYASKVDLDANQKPVATTAVFPNGSSFKSYEYGSMYSFPYGADESIELDSVSIVLNVPSHFSGYASQTMFLNIYEWTDSDGNNNLTDKQNLVKLP